MSELKCETGQPSDLPADTRSDATDRSGHAGELRHTAELFARPRQPRFFGVGDYDSGGPHTGNADLGELNPQGGYGSFTDAGGPGSTALLGEEAVEAEEPAAIGEPGPAK